ncbi:glycosyltransferase [Bacillus sp. PK3-056]|uniref:glycosyltransferase family 2 protein n=1 Tax=Niallia circulans TaxID=1397 RepID=UPI000F450D18|nr:glycosyltransferase [Niallia circulans]AYV73351.1 glycosyl transferase family 2 [Niallia circulans]
MSKISILIPTYNASKDIRSLLSKLYAQVIDDKEIEIIIIDSSSTDNTIQIIKEEFPSVLVEVIPNNSFDHGGTRNLLANKASGEYLLFMTQDAIPYDNYLLINLLEPLKTDNTMISFARQIAKNDASPLERLARLYNYPEKTIVKNMDKIEELGIKTFFNSNVCSMYKKEVFRKYGGFPEKIILNEDMILSSKVILDGYSVSYTSDAKVYHSHNYSIRQQFKRNFDIGMAFSETSYLLKYASNEKEGIKMVLFQIKQLFIQKKLFYLARSIVENFVKYIGYNLGKRHSLLPLKYKKLFSAYMK